MENNDASVPKRVTIVGGGLVGALNAVFFGKRGWDVDVFELRDDPRTLSHVPGRSINLAMSHRARSALASVDLEDGFLPSGIPMYGRLVHPRKGSNYVTPYGKPDQFILSVERRGLNEYLLSASEKFANVRWHFSHKLIQLDRKTGDLHFKRGRDQITKTKSDLILACDGAYSTVRQTMAKTPGFNFAQTYIPHVYIELTIRPKADKFAMLPNYFHLWPRGEFCLIALANGDKTFTVTLFAPQTIVEGLDDKQRIVRFFEVNFPDALDLIGKSSVLETFASVKPSNLVTIKCDPHHITCGSTQVLLLGDAAHAMVPFYGQGMNCGFEDCLYFIELLDSFGDQQLAAAVKHYSKTRVPHVHAACDLAVYNYNELRFLAGQRMFLIRKRIDRLLHRLLPTLWIPLYSMVTFTRTPYCDVVKRKSRQDAILRLLALTIIPVLLFIATLSIVGFLF